jgi:DNA repair protein RecO (recombination protein O)
VYNINEASVIKSYYAIGEDVEKYMCASFALEFTERLLPDGTQFLELFALLLDFFDLIETRKKKFMTLVMAFQLKAIQLMGVTPEINLCTSCGKNDNLVCFDVVGGGTVCKQCSSQHRNNELLYDVNLDIIRVLHYFFGNSLKRIEHIALDENILAELQVIVKEYRAYHLNISELKSDEFLKLIRR